jgi:hypothetical protein
MTDTTNLDTLRKLVGNCRERLESDLCELIEELGPTLGDEARELANASRDEAKRRDCLSLRNDIQGNWIKLTPVFRDLLARRADTTKPAEGLRPDTKSQANLHILSDDESALQVAMREIVDRISAACSEETYALERRINFLVLREVLPQSDSRFRVASVCTCLESACAKIFPEANRRIPLLTLIGGHLASELPQVFRAINEALLDADILPRLKRSYRDSAPASTGAATAEAARIINTLERLAKARTPTGGINGSPVSSARGREFLNSLHTFQNSPAPATAGGLTNVVRLARDSEAARHVPPLEAVTLDIISALFDLLFSDEHVSEGIKVLVSRLQMPVLKVAMLNQQFLADRSHPARRFLDSISGIAIRWGKFVNVDDPFYLKLSELVDRIQNTYDGDIGVFEAAIADLGDFIAERDVIEAEASQALAEAVRAREDEIRAQREGQANAQRAADEALAPLLTPAVPKPIDQFLRSYWRDVMQSRIFLSGSDGAPFAEALQIASELIWNVAPQKKAEDRQRQVAILRDLLKGLNAGLDEIGIAAEARRAFMDTLVELQLAALRADARVKRKPATKMESARPVIGPGPTLQVSHATQGGVRFQDISLPVGDDRGGENTPDRTSLRHVKQLVRGDWVDFIAIGQSQRERLTWINPSRSLLLFSNHAAECAISITPEALALRLKNQTAKLVKRDTAMFERALNGAVQSLDKHA